MTWTAADIPHPPNECSFTMINVDPGRRQTEPRRELTAPQRRLPDDEIDLVAALMEATATLTWEP